MRAGSGECSGGVVRKEGKGGKRETGKKRTPSSDSLPMSFRLRVVSGPDLGSEHPLDDGQEAVIGRGLDCTLRLADPTVSRRHCRIAVEDGQATLYDDDSRWGTLVNGEVTRCHQLKPGDRITVGETELLFEAETPPDATTLARPSDRKLQAQRPQGIDVSWEASGASGEDGGAGN